MAADESTHAAAPAGKQKLTVNLTDEAAEAVRDLAGRSNATNTEVIRRGIALQRFLANEIHSGDYLMIERADGRTERVHLLY